MAALFDASAQAKGSGSSLTFPLTVGNNAERLLMVGLGFTDSNPARRGATSVTFNGVALTRIASSDNGSDAQRAEVWYLIAPAIGTFNVVVSKTTDYMFASAVSYYQAAQDAQPHTSNTSLGNGSTATCSVLTTIDGTLMFDCISSEPVPTASGTQTTRSKQQGSQTYQNSGTSEKALASAGTGTMTWALDHGAAWRQVVVAIKPAPPHTSVTFTAQAKFANPTKRFTAKARFKKAGVPATFGAKGWFFNRAHKGPLADLEIRSIDMMKWIKDTTTGQPSDTTIENLVNYCQQKFNLTHIATSVPIDPEAWYPSTYHPSPRTLPDLYQKWADTIHGVGLRILHRAEMFSIQAKQSDTNGFLWRVGSNRYPTGTVSQVLPTTWTDDFNRTTIEKTPGIITYGTAFTDDFARASTAQSSNSIGSSYSAFGTGGGGWNIDTNRLKLFQPGNEFTYSIARTTAQYSTAEYLATVQARSSGKTGVIVYGFQVGGGTFYQGYVIYITSDNKVEVADLNVASTTRVPIASDTSLTFTPGQLYKIKVQTISTTMNIKVWPAAAIEPATPLITISNSKYGSGFFGLTAEGFNSDSNFYDDVSIKPLTVPGQVNEWNPTGSWGVSGNQIVCANATSTAGNQIYTKATYSDFTVAAKVQSLPGTGRTGLVFRYNSSTSSPGFTSYAVRIKDNTSLQLEDSTILTPIATTPKTITPSTTYWIKVDCQGTAIKARVWKDGDTEPTTWDIDTTSSKYTTGSIGFFPSNTATAAYDDITITPYQNLNSLLGITYKYIIDHPTLFANGDIWAPFPEVESGPVQGNDSTSYVPQASPGAAVNHSNFYANIATVARSAFQTIGKPGVLVGYSANNYSEVVSGWIQQNVYDAGQIVSFDYYQNHDDWLGSGTISSVGTSVTGVGTHFTTELFTSIVGGNNLSETLRPIFANGSQGSPKLIASIESDTNLTLATAFTADVSNVQYARNDGYSGHAAAKDVKVAYDAKGYKVFWQEWGPVPDAVTKTNTAIPPNAAFRDAWVRDVYDAMASETTAGRLKGFNYWGFWDTGANDTGLMTGSVTSLSTIKLRLGGNILREYFHPGGSPKRSFQTKARFKKGPGRLSSLPFRSVDLMKLTKDTTTSQPSDTVIQNYVSAAYDLMKNLTHMALVFPIDPVNWYPSGYTPSSRTIVACYQKWTDEIHKKGLNVLHRPVSFGMEGTTNFMLRAGAARYPIGTVSDVLNNVDRNSWLGLIYNFITANPKLFSNGDIWSPFPESTGGGATSRTVSSLTRSGDTVTVVTSSNHDLQGTTQPIKISGATPSAYNGSWIATVVNSTTCTFVISGTPTTPATGSISLSHDRNIFDDALSIVPSTSPGTQANYANLFIGIKQVSDAAFAAIGKQVYTGYSADNYTEIRSSWIPQSLYNSNHLVPYDYYLNYSGDFDFRGAKAKADLDTVYTARGNNPIFWSEWGTTPDMITNVNNHDSVNHFGNVSGANNPNRATWVTDFYINGLAAAFDQGRLVGFNYWGFWDTGDNDSGLVKLLGSTSTLSNFTLRAEGSILAGLFYDAQPKARFTAMARFASQHTTSFTSRAFFRNAKFNDLTTWKSGNVRERTGGPWTRRTRSKRD